MPPEPADADAIAAATKAYADADQRYQAFRGWCRARQIHAEITAWLTAGEVVGPEGLRSQGAGRAGRAERAARRDLEAMRCPAISLSADLEPLYGGRLPRPLAGLSGVQSSAQWRVNAAPALEIARADRSELVILDGGRCARLGWARRSVPCAQELRPQRAGDDDDGLARPGREPAAADRAQLVNRGRRARAGEVEMKEAA